MSGYVFWCTPCKSRHAGECPPCAEIALAFGEPPTIGSKWIEEQLDVIWKPFNSHVVWTVMAVDSDRITLSNGHISCGVSADAFSETGSNITGIWFRMSPAPEIR